MRVLPHMEGAVIGELGRVREELGWPIVMTPFAQMILTHGGDERDRQGTLCRHSR